MSIVPLEEKERKVMNDLPTAKPAIMPTTTASGIEVAGIPRDTFFVINPVF